MTVEAYGAGSIWEIRCATRECENYYYAPPNRFVASGRIGEGEECESRKDVLALASKHDSMHPDGITHVVFTSY